MPTVLSKLKDGSLQIGNLFIDKGVRWLECINKNTGNIDYYILESTWYMETHPAEKLKFAQKVYASCENNIKQLTQYQIDNQEAERIKQDERIAIFFEMSRLRGRSPLTIKPPQ